MLYMCQQPVRNSFFFDRDPAYFRIILNYLRNGCRINETILPRERRYLMEIKDEAEFYRIEGLRKAVEKRLKHLVDMYGLET